MQHGPKYRRLKAEADAYAQRWDLLQAEAKTNREIASLIINACQRGFQPHEIVDAFDKDPYGIVAEKRRRKAARDAAGGEKTLILNLNLNDARNTYRVVLVMPPIPCTTRLCGPFPPSPHSHLHYKSRR